VQDVSSFGAAGVGSVAGWVDGVAQVEFECELEFGTWKSKKKFWQT